jgi:hypothetical protein
MSIVWEETPRFARDRRPQGREDNNSSSKGTMALVALVAAATGALAASMVWPQGPAMPPASEAVAAEAPPPEPVTRTAPRVAAEPAALAEQPLPEGSARFALDAPSGEAIARSVIAKNWRPAGTMGAQIDAAATASIAAEDVAVAETEADVVRMEAELAAAGSDGFETPAAPDMVAGRTLKWVNLRSGPGNDAEVMTVVPFDAAILAEKDCPHWCAVTYDGRRGYIYKSFIGYDS